MCPFAFCARGGGSIFFKALGIALLAAGVGFAHSKLAPPLKLEVDAPKMSISDEIAARNAAMAAAGPATMPGKTAVGSLPPTPADPAPPAPVGGPAPAVTGAAPAPLAPPVKPVEPAPTAVKPAPATAHDASMIPLEKAVELYGRVTSAGDVCFVDARNPDEFVTGHIPTAFNLPPSAFFSGSIPAELEQMPRSNIIVVYCTGGECDASKLTAIRLREQGYTTVFVFEQGITGWKEAKLPIEK